MADGLGRIGIAEAAKEGVNRGLANLAFSRR